MDLVWFNDGRTVVSSRKVAEDFGKLHKNVLRDIRNIIKGLPKIEPIFFESTEPDAYGRQQNVFLMNRDGFTLLTMGLTGAKALQWKLKYIAAFNEMEAKLQGSPLTALKDLVAVEAARTWADNHEIEERRS
jgi:Rha family phage regulatory protein